MKPGQKADVKANLNALRAEPVDPDVLDLIDIVEEIIDSLPEERQPAIKPKGRGHA